MKYYLAIDNGVTGTICLMNKDGGEVQFFKMPVKKEQSYTKTKQNISRIDHGKLFDLLSLLISDIAEVTNYKVFIERPMVNPGRFKATVSALRALESTLVIVERWGFPVAYLDSKGWQKQLLPAGLKGEELKKASLDIGNRLFPQFKNFKHPDRDALLMAEFARRNNL